MNRLHPFTAQLGARRDLSDEQITAAAQGLAVPEVPDIDKAMFLTALADKGETAAEVAAFAAAFRTMSVDPGMAAWAPRAIDIVGTGGDHAGGFNISSLVVLVLASAGVPVMKHGNRGITSKCGSADLLAALGVDLAAPPKNCSGRWRNSASCFSSRRVFIRRSSTSRRCAGRWRYRAAARCSTSLVR
jgi:anthranilate phosphoribosyltransferase